jgi:hypothetical protein
LRATFATGPSERFMVGVIMSSTAAQEISCRQPLAAIARQQEFDLAGC